MLKSVICAIAITFFWCASCASAFAAVDWIADWNFKISAERTEQAFETATETGDATLNSVILSPGFNAGNWQFSMALPWQSIEGSYFFNNVYPNIAFACNQINALTGVQKFTLIRNTSVSLDDVRYCAQTGGVESQSLQESVSGWNDIELFINYLIPYGPNWLIGSIGMGYQDDNGRVDEGLGNGIKQTFVETSWFANAGITNLSMTLGYNLILDNNSGVERRDNGYLTMDGRLRLISSVELGVAYHFQQSGTPHFGDYDYLMYSIYCYLGQHWSGQAYFSDYSDGPEFPDREVGLYLSWSI